MYFPKLAILAAMCLANILFVVAQDPEQLSEYASLLNLWTKCNNRL